MLIPSRLYTRLQAVGFVALAIYLFQLVARGAVYRYVGIRAGWLAIPAAVMLVWMATALDLRHAEDEVQSYPTATVDGEQRHNVMTVLVLMLPLVMAAILPGHGLESAVVSELGMQFQMPAPSDYRGTELPDSERTILDWVYLFDTGQFDNVVGHQAEVEGFVYTGPDLGDNRYVVGRYVLTCCVPDATAAGIIVESTGAAGLPSSGWIRVSGVFIDSEVAGKPFPVLRPSSITPVLDDHQPYLYP